MQGQVLMAPPTMMLMTKMIDESISHSTLKTKIPGQIDVLGYAPLAASAKFLDCSGPSICKALCCPLCYCTVGFCCFETLVQPRSYIMVTENSFETNYPTLKCCPMESCVTDHPTKKFHDEGAGCCPGGVPYRGRYCTPFHTCWCIECCGEVLVVPPCDSCSGCLCHSCFPCFFEFYPGLTSADALASLATQAIGAFHQGRGNPARLGLHTKGLGNSV